MSTRDLNRAYALRRLYEKQLDRTDPALNSADRQRAAETMLDRLVGREWRGEAKLPGVRVFDTDVTSGGRVALNPEEFHDRVRSLLDDEGLAAPDEGGFHDSAARADAEDDSLHCRLQGVK